MRMVEKDHSELCRTSSLNEMKAEIVELTGGRVKEASMKAMHIHSPS